jgi:hypothetical protein
VAALAGIHGGVRKDVGFEILVLGVWSKQLSASLLFEERKKFTSLISRGLVRGLGGAFLSPYVRTLPA